MLERVNRDYANAVLGWLKNAAGCRHLLTEFSVTRYDCYLSIVAIRQQKLYASDIELFQWNVTQHSEHLLPKEEILKAVESAGVELTADQLATFPDPKNFENKS